MGPQIFFQCFVSFHVCACGPFQGSLSHAVDTTKDDIENEDDDEDEADNENDGCD